MQDHHQCFFLNTFGEICEKVFNKKYKSIKNKYNTYLNIGLPYGPINNPGLNALKATLFPEKTSKEYLYFVADGSGGHIFSENLNQHKLAIRKIRNGQKITK